MHMLLGFEGFAPSLVTGFWRSLRCLAPWHSDLLGTAAALLLLLMHQVTLPKGS